MDVREKLVELILSTDLGLSYSRESDALNIADNLIAHGVTVQEWISVKERLPDAKEYDWVQVNIRLMPEDYDGVPCVAMMRNGNWYDDHGGLLDTSEEGCGVIVTHWMPLPPAPNEDEQ